MCLLAPYVCETETRSGGPGKDTPLGKLEGGLTLTERPFPFGQAERPCPPLLKGNRGTNLFVLGRGQALLSMALESLTLVEIRQLETVCPAGMLVE